MSSVLLRKAVKNSYVSEEDFVHNCRPELNSIVKQMDRRLKGSDKCISLFFFFAIIGKRQHMHVLMFRKEARNATFLSLSGTFLWPRK